MTCITTLPFEILNQICHLVESKDIYALRLSCKALASSSFECFALQEVQPLRLAVTSDGLKFLEELACHEVLRVYVKVRPLVFDI